jgi:hypothetical protein
MGRRRIRTDLRTGGYRNPRAHLLDPIPGRTHGIGGRGFPDTTYLAAGEDGLIMRTADGGETWANNRSTLGWSTLLSFSFPAPGVGYLAGINSTVQRTEDGGKTWRKVGAPPGSASLYGSAFQNRDTGYVVGAEGSSGGIIHRTEDGGQTWAWQAQGKIEKLLFSVAILSGDSVYAVGSQGAVATTVDGGKEWNYYHAVDPVTLRDLACPVPARCHAVGDYGSVQLSGKRVRPGYFGTEAVLRSIACPSERVCFAAGDSGIVFRFDPTSTVGTAPRAIREPRSARRDIRENAPVFAYRARGRRADGRAMPSVRAVAPSRPLPSPR